jgi:hypothetical protein
MYVNYYGIFVKYFFCFFECFIPLIKISNAKMFFFHFIQKVLNTFFNNFVSPIQQNIFNMPGSLTDVHKYAKNLSVSHEKT